MKYIVSHDARLLRVRLHIGITLALASVSMLGFSRQLPYRWLPPVGIVAALLSATVIATALESGKLAADRSVRDACHSLHKVAAHYLAGLMAWLAVAFEMLRSLWRSTLAMSSASTLWRATNRSRQYDVRLGWRVVAIGLSVMFLSLSASVVGLYTPESEVIDPLVFSPKPSTTISLSPVVAQSRSVPILAAPPDTAIPVGPPSYPSPPTRSSIVSGEKCGECMVQRDGECVLDRRPEIVTSKKCKDHVSGSVAASGASAFEREPPPIPIPYARPKRGLPDWVVPPAPSWIHANPPDL
jgi:hypothetical protein